MKRGKQKSNTNPEHTKYKIFFLGIIAVVAVSILVVLFTNVQRSSSEQALYGAAITASSGLKQCDDTLGTYEIAAKDTIFQPSTVKTSTRTSTSGTWSAWTTAGTDTCSANTLKEWSCSTASTGANAVSTDVACQNGCTYGYCKTPTCTDSDGGIKYTIAGTTTGLMLGSNTLGVPPATQSATAYTDTCTSTTTLKEYVCSSLAGTATSKIVTALSYNCGGLGAGATCVAGKCVVPETTCDDIDNNGNGVVDEGCDDDNDNYCDSAMTTTETPTTCTAEGNDCQDTDLTVNPGATDICGNGIDEDCTGTDMVCLTSCIDTDGDGYQDPANPSGCSLNTAVDCNDASSVSNPGAAEICDAIDNNCDGQADETFDLAADNNNCGSCGTVCGAGDQCANSVCNIDVTSNMVSYWKFDEGTGIVAQDTSGPNEAQIPAPVADPQWVAGKHDTALDFDGDDYITIGTDSSLDICAGDLTIAFWAKWTQTTGNARDMIQLGKKPIKCAVSTGYNNEGQDKVSFGNTNTITGYQTWRYDAGTGLNDGNWHHIVVTKSGTDTVTIYVDGTTQSYSTGARYYTDYNYIGKGYHGNFKGSLDEIIIFKRALTPTQVQELKIRTSQ